MPTFVIDSVDFEYTFGGDPVTGTLKARVIKQGFSLDMQASLSPDSLRAIHEIMSSDLMKHWEGIVDYAPAPYTYTPLSVSRERGKSALRPNA